MVANAVDVEANPPTPWPPFRTRSGNNGRRYICYMVPDHSIYIEMYIYSLCLLA